MLTIFKVFNPEIFSRLPTNTTKSLDKLYENLKSIIKEHNMKRKAPKNDLESEISEIIKNNFPDLVILRN